MRDIESSINDLMIDMNLTDTSPAHLKENQSNVGDRMPLKTINTFRIVDVNESLGQGSKLTNDLNAASVIASDMQISSKQQAD